MLQRVVGLIVIFILLSARTSVAQDINFLEINFDRYETLEGDVLHDVLMDVGKDGATTCGLMTPTGTYSFINVGGSFQPQQDFIDNHIGLTIAELGAAISGGWTLTWDAGPTQTVVTIDFGFGSILESDFLPLPTITKPIGEELILIPADPNPPTVEWTNGSAPPDCDYAFVFLTDNAIWWKALNLIASGELTCNTTTWTPASPLTDGSWYVTVLNGFAALDVPVGITVLEGTWLLENSDWLDLVSSDRTLEVMPTKPISWGAIKTFYHR